jgi:hypothetical protein
MVTAWLAWMLTVFALLWFLASGHVRRAAPAAPA